MVNKLNYIAYVILCLCIYSLLYVLYQLYLFQENVVKYLKTTNKTEDEIQQFSKNIVEKPKEKLLLDPGDVLKNVSKIDVIEVQ